MSRSVSAEFAAIGLPSKKRKRQASSKQQVVVVQPQRSYVAARRADQQPPAGRKMEIKTVDTSLSTRNFDTDSAVANCMSLLNTVPTGNTAITRIGKSINMTALALRGRIASSTATTIERIAMLLIYVRNNNQAATLPAVTEILVTQGASALTNRDNASKFKIVRRWDLAMRGNTTTPAAGGELVAVDEFIRFKKPLIAQWTQGSVNGTIGEFEKGSLLLLTVGTTANGATTTPTFNGNARLYFMDP